MKEAPQETRPTSRAPRANSIVLLWKAQISKIKEHPLLRSIDWSTIRTQAEAATNPTLPEIAALTLILASPLSNHAMPSAMETEAAFRAVKQWRQLSEQKKQETQDDLLLCPPELYISLAFNSGSHAEANSELEKIDIEKRIQLLGLIEPAISFELPAANVYISQPFKEPAIRVAEALKSRAEQGREEPEAEKSMAELIGELVDVTWQNWEDKYREVGLTSKEELIFPPATEEQINTLERKVGYLPGDFKEFFRVTNR
jgi:hypothetical protein